MPVAQDMTWINIFSTFLVSIFTGLGATLMSSIETKMDRPRESPERDRARR